MIKCLNIAKPFILTIISYQINSTCPLKKIYDILKIQISKKITVYRNFFLSQAELRTHIDA